MLIGWGQTVDSFDTTVKRVSEVPDLVYFEVEERHYYGDSAHVVNSLRVFEFGADGKISNSTSFCKCSNLGELRSRKVTPRAVSSTACRGPPATARGRAIHRRGESPVQ